MAGEDRPFVHSTLRERIVEHVFVGDVLRTLWKRGVTDVEILRPEFNAHGYDVVMSRGQSFGMCSLRPRPLAKSPSGVPWPKSPVVVWCGSVLIRRRWTSGLSCGSGERQACRCRTSPNIAIPALHLLWLPQV